MRGMDLAAFETLHRGRKSIDAIAAETGINKSSLYRYGLPMHTNGLDIPMRKLTPIMKASGKYDLLHVLAAHNGFLCVRPPRMPRARCDENELIGRLQKTAADASIKTMLFFEKPTVNAMTAAENALNDTAAVAIGIKRLMLNRGQLEFGF